MSYLDPIRWCPAGPSAITRTTVYPYGHDALHELLAAGELRAGELVEWRQPRAGRVHVARVLDDGRLLVRGRPFTSVSAAARYACGKSVNGWEVWRCVRDGRLLGMKRDRLRDRRAR